MARSSWYADRNPFGLAKPPGWFLSEMRAYDDQLVIIPSRQRPLYCVTRRTTATPGLKLAADLLRDSDSAMFAQYGVVPVTTLMRLPWATWSHTFVAELASRDVWRHGGAAEVMTDIERQEVEARRVLDSRISDEAGERAKDAYTAWQLRSGQATGYRRPAPQPPANTTGGRLVLPGVVASRPAPQLVVATS